MNVRLHFLFLTKAVNDIQERDQNFGGVVLVILDRVAVHPDLNVDKERILFLKKIDINGKREQEHVRIIMKRGWEHLKQRLTDRYLLIKLVSTKSNDGLVVAAGVKHEDMSALDLDEALGDARPYSGIPAQMLFNGPDGTFNVILQDRD